MRRKKSSQWKKVFTKRFSHQLNITSHTVVDVCHSLVTPMCIAYFVLWACNSSPIKIQEKMTSLWDLSQWRRVFLKRFIAIEFQFTHTNRWPTVAFGFLPHFRFPRNLPFEQSCSILGNVSTYLFRDYSPRHYHLEWLCTLVNSYKDEVGLERACNSISSLFFNANSHSIVVDV